MYLNKKLLTGILLAFVLGIVYLGATHRWAGLANSVVAAQASDKDGRKVLYWYDAMNSQHHYNKPGKAPDGMDLVPMYETPVASENAPGASSKSPAMSTMPNMPQTSIQGERKILYWYDPMHPKYKSDKPGIAPDCGMTLVPKYADEQSMASMAAGTVMIPADKQILAGVRTSLVENKSLIRDIHTTAQIVADEAKIAHIHVKVAGYLDQVYVDFVGQFVKKGQPLFTLYSPDLVSAQEEYLIAKRGEVTLGSAPFADVADGAKSLLRSARERLKLWDISEEQIKKLDETGTVTKNLTFYSPSTGFITDRKAFPQTSVTPDTELYTLSDLSTVWADADIYENEVPYVHLGQKMQLTLSYSPARLTPGPSPTFIRPWIRRREPSR
jgi:hypothetical protein